MFTGSPTLQVGYVYKWATQKVCDLDRCPVFTSNLCFIADSGHVSVEPASDQVRDRYLHKCYYSINAQASYCTFPPLPPSLQFAFLFSFSSAPATLMSLFKLCLNISPMIFHLLLFTSSLVYMFVCQYIYIYIYIYLKTLYMLF